MRMKDSHLRCFRQHVQVLARIRLAHAYNVIV